MNGRAVYLYYLRAVLWCLAREIRPSISASVLKGSKSHEPRRSKSGISVPEGVWWSQPQGLTGQPHFPACVDQVVLFPPFRLPDPAPDAGGHCEQNRSSARGNATQQRRPVRGARLAFVRGGGGRPKGGREYLVLGSPLRGHA